jgi:hypothetical protein
MAMNPCFTGDAHYVKMTRYPGAGSSTKVRHREPVPLLYHRGLLRLLLRGRTVKRSLKTTDRLAANGRSPR